MKICKLFGTDIVLHWSLIIPFIIVAGSPTHMMFLAIIFVIVVFHEYGHIAASRWYGNDCKTIVLSAIGGMAFLEREAEKPGEEFVVAICGPLVNLVLLIPSVYLGVQTEYEFWILMSIANFFLMAFNLIPAFPMDGGRMLRAIVWKFSSREWATKFCAIISLFICSLGLGTAVYNMHLGLGLVSIVIGVYAATTVWGKIPKNNLTNDEK